jgi:hypothetical protein
MSVESEKSKRPKKMTSQEWFDQKKELLKTIREAKGPALFTSARLFCQTLRNCEESPGIIKEKEVYGVGPPAYLRILETDSDAVKSAKKEVWKCYIGGHCSCRKNVATKSCPFILVRIDKDSYWEALDRVGFKKPSKGVQFVCLGRIRMPEKSTSAYVLKQWLLNRTIPPEAEISFHCQPGATKSPLRNRTEPNETQEAVRRAHLRQEKEWTVLDE